MLVLFGVVILAFGWPIKAAPDIKDIISGCGELCKVSGGTFSEGKYFQERSVPVDCASIFDEKVFVLEGHGEDKAPAKLPEEWLDEFTLGGKVVVKPWYFNRPYVGKKSKTPEWSYEQVEEMIAEAKAGTLKGTYPKIDTTALLEGLSRAPGVNGGHVLVIGSEMPWVEACVLASGARNVTTLEYGVIISKHPRIHTLLPADYRKVWSTLPPFDAIVTYSSVEHSGLGRYGDALNPWGDVLEIARAWCVAKSGASLTIAVPSGGVDHILHNAHRIYGPVRYPYLTSNWHQVWKNEAHKIRFEQYTHVFTKS
jgi:hypothetical protein